MSTATDTAGVDTHTDHDEHHPSDGTYWKVGAILGAITLAEISTYFIADPPYDHELAPLLIGSLLVMMVAKFAAIGAYFMHLKFDSPILRWAFIGGLVLAVGVYLVVLATFAFWDQGYEASLALLT
ncbi:MAG: cytochrome C oxidase subunit IV family protein [Acidimicrobiales bacterium]|nr:cytochrome C oxidase subunit IV family protein [Acidimicrobiales bacterium]